VRNNKRVMFFVVRAARVATQRCGKHIYEVLNQHATLEEVVLSVVAAPRLHNEDLRQLTE
jgi:hypothetical protein